MKFKLIVLSAFSALVLASCSKDDDTSVNTSDPSFTNIPSASGDCFPMSVGNEWSYEGGVDYKTFIDADTTIDNETYYVVQNDQGGRSYMRKSGTDYLVIDEGIYKDFNPHVIIKEEGIVGDSWGFDIFSTEQGLTSQSEYIFTIHNKLATKTVDGTTYSDILVIDLDINVYFNTVLLTSVNDSRYYYAKGIGLISSELPNTENTDLKGYTVN